MSRHWFEQRERGTPFALRLILWIALHLGRTVARSVLYPITLYFYLTAEDQRESSRAYLRRVLERQPGRWQILRHIHCFAATILDRVFLLSDRLQGFDIRIHDTDLLLERMDAGRGCILLGSHLGSFEVLRALASRRRHFPLKVLMYPEHNRSITGILETLNPEVADTVIPLGEVDSLIAVADNLREGWAVGMLGDRAAAGDRVTSCRFLGGEVSFPVGPFLLAAATGAPLILFFGLYQAGARYDIHFELLSERVELDRSRREEQIRRLTQRYADRLAHYTRQTPYNWFNFFDYWNEH